MANETLLIDAGLVVITGLLYAYVGRVSARHGLGPDAQLAADLFSTWWYALGAVTASGALIRIFAYAGVRDIAVYATISHIALLGICVAVWGLLYYLVYLFTGNRRWLLPLSLYYGVVYAFFVYVIAWRAPIGIEIEPWSVTIAYARELSGPTVGAVVLAFILPPVIGAIGYARLFFRVTEATQRYRIGLISGTIIAWFGSSLVAWGFAIDQLDWWQAASRVIGLASALVIYAAYRPPLWVKKRWSVDAVEDATSNA